MTPGRLPRADSSHWKNGSGCEPPPEAIPEMKWRDSTIGRYRIGFCDLAVPELCKGGCSSSGRKDEPIEIHRPPAVAVGSAGSPNYGERVDEQGQYRNCHTKRCMVKWGCVWVAEAGGVLIWESVREGIPFPCRKTLPGRMKPSISEVWVRKWRCCCCSDTGVPWAKEHGATNPMTNLLCNPKGKRSVVMPSKYYRKEIAIVLLVWCMGLSECFFGSPFYRIIIY